MINRRDFLIKAYRIGGIAALFRLGMSFNDARVFAGKQLLLGQLARNNVSAGGGSCETAVDTCNDGGGGNAQTIAQYSGYEVLAGTITADGSDALCKVAFPLYKAGSPSGANGWAIEIWDDNAGEPNALISGQQYTFDADSTVSPTDATTAQANWTSFDIDWTPTATNTYHVLIGKLTAFDNSNYLVIERHNNCTPDGSIYRSNYDKSAGWTASTTSYNLPYIFYKA